MNKLSDLTKKISKMKSDLNKKQQVQKNELSSYIDKHFHNDEALKNLDERIELSKKNLKNYNKQVHPELYTTVKDNIADLEKQKIDYIKSKDLEKVIPEFLKRKDSKLTASDIAFQLYEKDIDLIKEVCESLSRSLKIQRTDNYRYFVNQSKNEPKISSNKSGNNINIKVELEKLKILFDEGLITKEQYEAKSNKLLGI